ncbi:MAG TPA: hypothetical protein VGO40_13075 [Longimicrobium sp.]|jgi:hypothetical protein|nr:hypothetical protein [Longimicrobium sp.]
MSRLATGTGAEFASGESPCFLHPAVLGDQLTRLFVYCRIGDAETTAVVDTGGAFLVLDPKLADSIGVDHRHAIARERIHIRGFVQRGTIHRLPLTLLAAAGEPLTFEATAFVPEMEHGETWPLPSYLGWQGCLDRIRFAVDPVDEVVYFGAIG